MNNVVDIRDRDEPALPASEVAEQALLGAILVRSDVIDDVAGFLLAEHFRYAAHRPLYEAALSLHREGRKVDAITLAAATESDPEVSEMGGIRYIAELAASTTSILNATDYGRLILDMHLRRELIAAGQQIAADAFRVDLERPGSDQAEDAVRRITEVAEASLAPQQGPRPIGEAVSGVVDQLAAVCNAEGAVVGHPTGLQDLDRSIGGLMAPDLLVVAGRPGMGKSILVLNIARHVATHSGPVAFYSLEMSSGQLMQRMIAADTGVPVERQRAGPIHRGEFMGLQSAAQEIGALPLLLDDGRQRTVAAMRAHARRAKRRGGLALVVVDYLQLMVQGDPRYRVQEVSQITRDLKMLALDVGVPVLAVSQLSRQVEQRDDKRPNLSDLRDSGSIEQDADMVLFPYREEYYLRAPKQRERQSNESHLEDLANFDHRRRAVAGLAEIIVGKNRHGPTATVECRFDGPRQRFRDRDGADQEGMF